MNPILGGVLIIEGICYASKLILYIAADRGEAKPKEEKWLRRGCYYPTPIDFFVLFKDAHKIDKYKSELRKQKEFSLTDVKKEMEDFYSKL